MNTSDFSYLRRAITLAAQARDKGNHAFGALLVGPNGHIILEAENTVITESDCTGHAETNLVRQASGRFSPEYLRQCTLYTSTEPCAMCAGAIFWSGIPRVVFALSSDRLYAEMGDHENRLDLSSRQLFSHAARPVSVDGPFIEEEALAPFLNAR